MESAAISGSTALMFLLTAVLRHGGHHQIMGFAAYRTPFNPTH
jgi:hypothetical protein